MRWAVIALLALVIGLVVGREFVPGPAAPVRKPAEVAAPASTPVVVLSNPPYWQHFDGTLSHIPEESDAISISFSCEQSGVISILEPHSEGEPDTPITLRSGNAIGVFKAKLTPDDELYDRSAVAKAPSNARVFQEFRRTGVLVLWGGYDVRAKQPKEFKAIADFFSGCARL